MESLTNEFAEIEKLVSQLYEKVKDYKRSDYDNLFTSISDTFYRENFHSDILCYLFKFDEAKEELIKWFNRDLNLKIDFDKYKGGEVLREKGHRDITLYSKDRKRVVIVENKSNGADDQDKQILGYVETLEDCESGKIIVDGILYINKYSLKEPEHNNWLEKYKKIKHRILITKLLGSNSMENILNTIIDKSKDKRLIGISLEIKNLFNIIINGKMTTEMSNLRDIINQSSIRKQFLIFLQYEENFAYLFENEYISDINKFKENYIVKEIDRYDEYGRNIIYLDFTKDDMLISIDVEFKKTLYSISLIISGRSEQTIKNNIDLYNNKLEALIKELGIDCKIQRNKRGERKRFTVHNSQSAFEKNELLNSIQKLLKIFSLEKNK